MLYINALLEIAIENCSIISHTDDTMFICSSNTSEKVLMKLEMQIRIIHNWLVLSMLALNIDKTISITFCNYMDSIPVDFGLKINGDH